MRKNIVSLIGSFIVLFCVNGYSQEQNYDLGPIVVTATKTEIYQEQVGVTTRIVTNDELEKAGLITVDEALRVLPGVSVSKTGATGGVTSVYLRGAKPGHILVLIDGVEVNDPMGIDRGFDFTHVLIDNIDRIEILQGPQSTLYGSDALGGVINIITKKGEGPLNGTLRNGGGSFHTMDTNLNLNGVYKQTNYSFSFSRFYTGGVSQAAHGVEKDKYENYTISSLLGYDFSDTVQLKFTMRYTDVDSAFDDASFDDDNNNISHWKNLAVKAQFIHEITDFWNHTLSASYSNINRKYYDDDSFDSWEFNNYEDIWYKGNTRKIEWQHNFIPVDWSTTTAGFEYEQEQGHSYYYLNSKWFPLYESKFGIRTVDNKGFYLQNQFSFGESLFITPGIRMDDHETFGNYWTKRVAFAYVFKKTNTHFKANWGTGFKAPSLYQLYSDYGDSLLKPEKSNGYDFGFEQKLLQDKVSFGATYFYNKFKDLIDYNLTTWKYYNVGAAITKGVEIVAKYTPVNWLAFGINYTYLRTKDLYSCDELLRRPKHSVNFDINWKFSPKTNFNVSVAYVGNRHDVDTTVWPSTAVLLKQRTQVNLFYSYDIRENMQVFIKAKNIFDDRRYEIYGYNSEPRGFYAGMKVKF